MQKRWKLVWWVAQYSSPIYVNQSLLQINADEPNHSGLEILYRHMYREPEESKANDVLYTIPYKLMMDTIRQHVEVDHARKRTVKRKNDDSQQDVFQGVVHKRKKMIEALTHVASGSKSKPGSSK